MSKLRKVDKLRIGNYVAPRILNQDEKTKNRRIALIDNNGNITGYTTLEEVQKQILKRINIEFGTNNKRPDKVICKRCGRIIKVSKQGHIRKICKLCTDPNCIKCGKILPGKGYRHQTRCNECRMKDDKKIRYCIKCEVKIDKTNKSDICRKCKPRIVYICEICNKILVNNRAKRCKKHASKERKCLKNADSQRR